MNLNIDELGRLLKVLEKLSANEENWKLQERIIREIERLEKE